MGNLFLQKMAPERGIAVWRRSRAVDLSAPRQHSIKQPSDGGAGVRGEG